MTRNTYWGICWLGWAFAFAVASGAGFALIAVMCAFHAGKRFAAS